MSNIYLYRLNRLKAFLTFLHKNGIIDINRIDDDSDDGFINRLKIQKCTYLARFYGLDLGYEYDMYIYGPYSVKLAEDYYSIIRDFKENNNSSGNNNNNGILEFKSNKFLTDIKSRTPEWLEVATTILDQYGIYGKNREKLIKHVSSIKTYETDYINNVYEDLKEIGLIAD